MERLSSLLTILRGSKMFAALLVVLVAVDTFATGYLISAYSRLRRDYRSLNESVSSLGGYCDELADDLAKAVRDE